MVRQAILESIDPAVQSLPDRPAVAFVWPTDLCSIGCAHCNFASRRTGEPARRLLASHPDRLVEWLASAGTRKVVICGGGEPLDEPEFVTRTISGCARLGLECALYTSGVSHRRPFAVREKIQEWRDAWRPRVRPEHRLGLRLSVDLFHEERIGLEPVVQWLEELERLAPEWRCAIRGIRVEGDGSVERLAARLGAELRTNTNGSAWMVLPRGRRILVQRKGFIFDGRGRPALLARRRLQLDSQDRPIVEELVEEYGAGAALGRPLSARLTLTSRHVELEVHGDGVVHILESSAPDCRLSLFDHTWESMKRAYYRDPILHRVAVGGLPAVAALIRAARRSGVGSRRTVPYSIELLDDPDVLAWVTATAVLSNGPRFVYDVAVVDLARRYLDELPPGLAGAPGSASRSLAIFRNRSSGSTSSPGPQKHSS
jgi:hypothetical protein